MTFASAALAPHLAVLIGLLLGTMARVGFVYDQGGTISPRQILGQLMMLGVCGLVAEAGTEVGQLLAPAIGGPTIRALTAAGIALIPAKVIVRLRLSAESSVNARFPVTPPSEPPK